MIDQLLELIKGIQTAISQQTELNSLLIKKIERLERKVAWLENLADVTEADYQG